MDVPDYIFDQPSDAQQDAQLTAPDRGGLHIASVAAVDTTTPVTLVVQSQDYGGSAILTAKAIITGPNIMGGKVTVPFNVLALDPITNQVTKEDVRPPSCVGAADFAKHPFASLPVDQDCNGIADDWEGKHGGPFPDPTVDSEQGGSKPGDGFSVFDEYRGFHYVTDDWNESNPDQSKIKWTSTDPTQKDIFFWDTSTDGRYTQALRTILEKRTGYVFRRVSAEQANAKPGGAADGVEKLNKNSPTKGATYNYALVYLTGTASEKGAAGTSGGNLSNGLPITIDEQKLADECQKASFPLDVLRAVVVAHESGHKFALEHYLSVLLYTSAVPEVDPPSSLTFQQYALCEAGFVEWALCHPNDPAAMGATLGRYTTYQALGGNWTTGDHIVDLYDVAGNIMLSRQFVVQGQTDSILRHNWLYMVVPDVGRIWVLRQWSYIMDWSPRINQLQGTVPDLRSADAWYFRPGEPSTFTVGDLDLMCVQCHP